MSTDAMPDRQVGHSPITELREAQSAAALAADEVADLITATLTAMFGDRAAWLQLSGDDVDDNVTLSAVLAGDGEVLHDFDGRRLPELADPELVAAWTENGRALDYRDQQVVETFLREARDTGLYLPQLPDDVRAPDDLLRWTPCLSLR